MREARLTFNEAQRSVLNVMSCLTDDTDIIELKKVLVKFLNEKLQRELDKLWDNGTLSQEKLDKISEQHLRTAYK